MKNIPLIILTRNQLTYLLNLINWWKFYYPANPVYVIDNASDNQRVLRLYDTVRSLWDDVVVVCYPENNCAGNLKDFLSQLSIPYYFISDADIMPCPGTPPDFLEIFRHCIEHYGFNHVGFGLKTDDIPEWSANRQRATENENSLGSEYFTFVYQNREYCGRKAPIDTTFAMYKGGDGWECPMPGYKWGNSLRLFDAFHLPWYLGNVVNEEMYHYFTTARPFVPGGPSAGLNNYRPGVLLHKQGYDDIVNGELLQGAIENNGFPGFREDYHVLHCLMRKYHPATVFEVGTNTGTGTRILKNAVMDAVVFTLDLPAELAHTSLQHPISEGKGDRVGKDCHLPFIQLRGDSMEFDFSQYPCEAYYIDGEHDQAHVYRETTEVLKCRPKLIVWHDADIPGVFGGILKAFENNTGYDLFRVTDTRVAYAVKK